MNLPCSHWGGLPVEGAPPRLGLCWRVLAVVAMLAGMSAAHAGGGLSPENEIRAVAAGSAPAPKADPLRLSLTQRVSLPAQADPRGAMPPADATRLLAGPGLPAELQVRVGRALVVNLPAPVLRVAVADPAVADFRMVSANELYVLGKSVGSTNLVLWDAGGRSTLLELVVGLDIESLQRSLRLVLPGESGLDVVTAPNTVVLRGVVTDSLASDTAEKLAEGFVRSFSRAAGQGQAPAVSAPAVPGASQTAASRSPAGNVRVLNLLKLRDVQQVMLEVRVAEISKTLLNRLGVQVQAGGGGGTRWSVLSGFQSGGGGVLSLLRGAQALTLDAQKNDGLVKILAEPNIVAQSGHEGSFLAGGKVFIPVTQSAGAGAGASVTLQEREYGVGLKFVPTVLDGGRIELKVAQEVSELSKDPMVYQSGSSVSLSPAMTTRRVATTVQLQNGQSLVIGGLISNNLSESINAFPGLGELPVLGALFRSSQFNTSQSELVVVITPSLVKPMEQPPELPSDKFRAPSRTEFFLENKMEGRPRDALPSPHAAP